jgi:hypothetical protein
LKFLTAGALGIMLTFFFQSLSWYRDANLRRVEKNVENALQAFDQVTLMIADRWYATFRMIQGLSLDPQPRDFDERVRNYARAVADWNLKSDLMLSRLEVFYDLPRKVAKTVSLRNISQVDCTREFFQNDAGEPIQGLEPRSFKARFIALSHCFRGVHSELLPLLQEIEQGRPRPRPDLKATIEKVQKKSDDLFTHANVLRGSLLGETVKFRNDDSALNIIPKHMVRPRFMHDDKEQ